VDVERNEIGEQGCQHLAKSEWPNLEYLNLGNFDDKAGENRIGNRGCRYLLKMPCSTLVTLFLSSAASIEATITLEKEVARSYPRLSGKT
jgi:hypothetical protein